MEHHDADKFILDGDRVREGINNGNFLKSFYFYPKGKKTIAIHIRSMYVNVFQCDVCFGYFPFIT